MGRFTFGVILGLAIGIIDVLLMLPLAFPDKRSGTPRCLLVKVCAGFLRFGRQASNVTHRIRGPGWCSHEHPGRDRYEGLRANSHYRRGVRRDDARLIESLYAVTSRSEVSVLFRWEAHDNRAASSAASCRLGVRVRLCLRIARHEVFDRGLTTNGLGIEAHQLEELGRHLRADREAESLGDLEGNRMVVRPTPFGQEARAARRLCDRGACPRGARARSLLLARWPSRPGRP